ncbi:hypothetical protein CQ046_02270 [Chryseobacterium sp. MYb7]|nr:hypothetical protein CQ046_02270 [Chryseobacterium sp. MYb7]
MTTEIFEKLIKQSESDILDFKRSEYDFSSNAPEPKKSEFIKDIISFSNTIRNETSYIIIGIEENNKKIELKGITQITDDSILQQKVKVNVFPIPTFRYYSFLYKNMLFGIIEFPIKKYERPITPTVKLKGLQPGMVYFRRNSSNDEANASEIIHINNWLNSLSTEYISFEEIINKHLLEILDDSIPLSKIIVQLLNVSKKFDITKLKKFCEREIKGLIKGENYSDDEIYSILDYRVKTVTALPYEINLEAASYYTSSQLLQVLKNEHGAWDQQLLLQYSILKIENHIKNFPKGQNTLLHIKDKMNDEDIYIYFDKQRLQSYYQSIREELKNLLINLL